MVIAFLVSAFRAGALPRPSKICHVHIHTLYVASSVPSRHPLFSVILVISNRMASPDNMLPIINDNHGHEINDDEPDTNRSDIEVLSTNIMDWKRILEHPPDDLNAAYGELMQMAETLQEMMPKLNEHEQALKHELEKRKSVREVTTEISTSFDKIFETATKDLQDIIAEKLTPAADNLHSVQEQMKNGLAILLQSIKDDAKSSLNTIMHGELTKIVEDHRESLTNAVETPLKSNFDAMIENQRTSMESTIDVNLRTGISKLTEDHETDLRNTVANALPSQIDTVVQKAIDTCKRTVQQSLTKHLTPMLNEISRKHENGVCKLLQETLLSRINDGIRAHRNALADTVNECLTPRLNVITDQVKQDLRGSVDEVFAPLMLNAVESQAVTLTNTLNDNLIPRMNEVNENAARTLEVPCRTLTEATIPEIKSIQTRLKEVVVQMRSTVEHQSLSFALTLHHYRVEQRRDTDNLRLENINLESSVASLRSIIDDEKKAQQTSAQRFDVSHGEKLQYLSDLCTQFEEHASQLESLQASREDRDEALCNEMADIKSEVQVLRMSVDADREAIIEAQRSTEAQQQAIKALQTSTETNAITMESIKSAVDASQVSVNEAVTSTSTNRQSIIDVKTCVESEIGSIKESIRNEIQTVKTKVEEVKTSGHANKKHLQELKSELETVKTSVDANTAHLKELKPEIQTVKTDVKAAKTAAVASENQLKEIKPDVQSVKIKVEEVKTAVDATETNLNELEQKVVKMSSTVEESNTIAVASKKHLEELRPDIGIMKTMVEEVKIAADTNDDHLTEVKSDIDLVKTKVEEAKVSTDAIKKDLEETKASTDAIKKDLEELKTSQDRLLKFQEDNSHLKSTLQNVEKILLSLQSSQLAQSKLAEDRAINLEKSIEDLESHVGESRSDTEVRNIIDLSSNAVLSRFDEKFEASKQDTIAGIDDTLKKVIPEEMQKMLPSITSNSKPEIELLVKETITEESLERTDQVERHMTQLRNLVNEKMDTVRETADAVNTTAENQVRDRLHREVEELRPKIEEVVREGVRHATELTMSHQLGRMDSAHDQLHGKKIEVMMKTIEEKLTSKIAQIQSDDAFKSACLAKMKSFKTTMERKLQSQQLQTPQTESRTASTNVPLVRSSNTMDNLSSSSQQQLSSAKSSTRLPATWNQNEETPSSLDDRTDSRVRDPFITQDHDTTLTSSNQSGRSSASRNRVTFVDDPDHVEDDPSLSSITPSRLRSSSNKPTRLRELEKQRNDSRRGETNTNTMESRAENSQPQLSSRTQAGGSTDDALVVDDNSDEDDHLFDALITEDAQANVEDDNEPNAIARNDTHPGNSSNTPRQGHKRRREDDDLQTLGLDDDEKGLQIRDVSSLGLA